MRPGGIDLRLAVPATAAWCAAGLLVGVPTGAWWCAAACGTTLVALVLLHRRPWAGLSAVSVVAVGLAACAVALAAPNRHPAALDSRASGHAAVVRAVVETGVRPAAAGGFGGGAHVTFQVTARDVTVGRERIVGRIPALVYASANTAPRIGETLELDGTLRALPDGDDVALLVYASSARATGPPSPWLVWADDLRAGFRTATSRMPGDGGQLLAGLAIGDESRIGAELDTAMKASSLSHLTAVSGSNCAVIIGGVLALGAACGLSRRLRLAAALLALAGFVVLVTPGASVLRAAVMGGIVVTGTALGRPGRAVPALGLAVLVLVVHDPWISRDYGFALSVLATAALLVLARPLARRLERVLPRWLAAGLAVPLAAQLACQPVLVLLNPTVPLYGVAANVLAEPAAPLATVLGLIGCLLLPFLPTLAAAVLWCAWAPSAWIAEIARTTVALPGSALPWPAGVAGLALAVVLTLEAVVLVVRPASAGGRWVRGALGGGAAAVLVVALALQAGPAVAARAAMPRDWIVGMCDVGQGDAIVLHDGDAYGLIDTGPDPAALTSCLRELGIRRLTLLVLTHYDLDHVGGVDAVAGKVDTALVGHPDDADANRRLALLRAGGAAVHEAERGDAGALGGLRWKVLWPDGAHPELATSNEGGVTIEAEVHGIRMLFLADLDETAQDAVISDGGLDAVDVVKVAHHGSADQSERLYGLIHARLGLISDGAGNDYGHPTANALRLLRTAGTAVARTDLEGMVLVTARAGALGLWTQRRASDAALWTPARR